jgi:hypothetical protein
MYLDASKVLEVQCEHRLKAQYKKGPVLMNWAFEAPAARLELATDRLTADCSTTELSRSARRSEGRMYRADLRLVQPQKGRKVKNSGRKRARSSECLQLKRALLFR